MLRWRACSAPPSGRSICTLACFSRRVIASISEAPAEARSGANRKLLITALGVVFGDIGTSPLYALRECFNPAHGIAVTESNVLGLLVADPVVPAARHLGQVHRASCCAPTTAAKAACSR